ncbi:MAG: site-specific integrase, partial [Byssovorax sp.]
MTSKKSTYGLGSIDPRGGKLRLRVPDGRGGTRTLGNFNTLEEAESVQRGWAHLRKSGEVVDGVVFAKYGEGWLDRRELAGVKSIERDRSRWRTHVLTAPFAGWPIDRIGRRDLRAWIDELTAKLRKGTKRRISPQTVRHCVNLVRGCLAEAVEDELLEKNPAIGLTSKRTPASNRWTYLVVDEQRRLLTADVIPEMERLTIEFALGSGLRQGEHWCLKLRDVDVGSASPRVIVRGKEPKGHNPGGTKSGKIRVVPLFGIALAAARRVLALLPTFCKKNPLGLMFPTARGYQRREGKPPRGWRSYLEAAGLGDPARRHDGRAVRWHDLRHSCATSLVAGWWGHVWSLDRVRDVLGHSSVTVTERYAHLAPSVLAAEGLATTG